MNLNSRLKQLEKGPFRLPEDGSCRGCWHRKNDHLTILDDDPLPEPCQVCGCIPEASVMYLYTPIAGKEREAPEIPEVLKKARYLAVFPTNGRGDLRKARLELNRT